MTTIELKIDGMRCENCVSHVEKALKGVSGVSNVDVSLEKKQAVVECDETTVSSELLIQSVEDAGYDAKVSIEHRS